MTPEQVVKRTLFAHAGISAIVGTRISPMKSLELGDLPCLTWSMIGCRPEHTHDGQTNMQDPSVQIDCWVKLGDYETMRRLRSAVLDCLTGSDSPLTGVYFFVDIDGTDLNEPEVRMARKMIQATLWYNATL